MSEEKKKKKVIIDVDTGVDDAQAIMMAVASDELDILAITCTHGNTSLENSCKNTLRVLKVCGKLDQIPVHRGCHDPMLGIKRSAGDFHGKDGLGDCPDPNAPGLDKLDKRKAVQTLIKTVKEHPGEVTLIATGPLTNLASAAVIDKHFPEKVKALYIMGGNTESRGNTTACGEFNFVADPEAAFIVLDRFTCPIYIATWEFSCRNSLTWSFCNKWLDQDTDKARFMKQIYQLTMEKAKSSSYQKEVVEGPGFNTCDCYAMAAAIDESLVLEKDEVAVTVELEGKYTRGMMVLDYMEVLKKKHKATVLKTVDLKKFEQLLWKALQ